MQAIAKLAAGKVRKAPQTRTVAHTYPVRLIEAALNLHGDVVAPSESEGSPFRVIVEYCYTAANVPNSDPLRAIRAFLQELNASPEK